MKKKSPKPVSDKELKKVSGGGEAIIDLSRAKGGSNPTSGGTTNSGSSGGMQGTLMPNTDTEWDADGR